MSSGTSAQTPRKIERWPVAAMQEQNGAPARQAGVAFLASVALPGAGQAYLGMDRWAPYLAVEGWAWISYINHRTRGRSLEQSYRDLAWSVARRICGCQRADTVFAYYEAMAGPLVHESGPFDADPVAPGLQPPEGDTLTFNGKQWDRAKKLFFPGGRSLPPGAPAYDNALAYYERTAIPPGYAWSWGDNDLEKLEFARQIRESDTAFRSATRALGLILANHLVSAIDALVTARLLAGGSGSQRLELGSELLPAGNSVRWTATVRINLRQ